MRIEILYVTLVHFLLCGGDYGTLYHQAVTTSYTAADSALHRYVCPDPTPAWRTGGGIVQSPSHCSRQGCPESTFWLRSAALYSVFQMDWKCSRWRRTNQYPLSSVPVFPTR